MFTIAFLGELEIRFIEFFSNHRKTMFDSDVDNDLKEFETFIFDENVLKACDTTVIMYDETFAHLSHTLLYKMFFLYLD